MDLLHLSNMHQIAPTIFPSIIFPCLRITGCFMPSFHLSCSLPNGSDQPAKECQIGESFLRVPNTEALKFQMYHVSTCLNNCCGCGHIRNSMTCPRTQGSDSVGRPCMCPRYAPDRTYNLHEMHTWKLSIFTLPILALSFAMVRSKSKHSSLDSAKLSILERSCRADLDNRAVSFHAMLKTTSLSLLILQYVLGRFCSDSSLSALDFPSISIRICCQPFLWSQPPWDWRLSSFIPLSCPKILQSCRFCSRQTFQESA